MNDPQHDARRRLLIALALERSRASSALDGELRRALERDPRAEDGPRRGGRGPGDDEADGSTAR